MEKVNWDPPEVLKYLYMGHADWPFRRTLGAARVPHQLHRLRQRVNRDLGVRQILMQKCLRCLRVSVTRMLALRDLEIALLVEGGESVHRKHVVQSHLRDAEMISVCIS